MALKLSLSIGRIIPITNADTTNTQSRLETWKKFCIINANIRTDKTTIACADSIPKANSKSGKIFEEKPLLSILK